MEPYIKHSHYFWDKINEMEEEKVEWGKAIITLIIVGAAWYLAYLALG
jgi:hypothetical protein